MDHQFVIGGKFFAVVFFGQVNLPQLPPAVIDRHPQEGLHHRVIFRKAHAARVVRQVGQADRIQRVHQSADQPHALRGVRHAGDFREGHADWDEGFKFARWPDDTDRGVARVGLFAGHFGNFLEERFQRHILHQLQAGFVQGKQTFFELFAG